MAYGQNCLPVTSTLLSLNNVSGIQYFQLIVYGMNGSSVYAQQHVEEELRPILERNCRRHFSVAMNVKVNHLAKRSVALILAQVIESVKIF